jgi:S1-C subfamily serine protease
MRKFKTGNTRSLTRGIAMVLLVCSPWALFGQAAQSRHRAGPADKTPKTLSLPEAINVIRESTVQINYLVTPEPGTFVRSEVGLLGTGFEVSDGYFITANHVVDDFNRLQVTVPHMKKSLGVGIASLNRTNVRATFRTYEVVVVDVDPIHDLALLHQVGSRQAIETIEHLDISGPASSIGSQLPQYPTLKPAVLSIGRPDDGEGIATSGYPLSEAVLLTTSGTVASSWAFFENQSNSPDARTGFAKTSFEDRYLADLRVNHGNSGGPVYSIVTGAVIGVCKGFEDADVETHAVPSISFEGKPLIYNSGVSWVIPARYAAALLDKNKVEWTPVK